MQELMPERINSLEVIERLRLGRPYLRYVQTIPYYSASLGASRTVTLDASLIRPLNPYTGEVSRLFCEGLVPGGATPEQEGENQAAHLSSPFSSSRI